MIYEFFSLEEAINFKHQKLSPIPFIIAHERLKRDKTVGRCFYVFPSFNIFLEKRDEYPHAHEILASHHYCKEREDGRLVFDFDISMKEVENIEKFKKRFKKEVEIIIWSVIEENYKGIDLEKIEFVWSSSKKKDKMSKHLTIKNFCFKNWLIGSKLFYQLFKEKWMELLENWIPVDKVLDCQIIRKNGTLRMVGCKKINGKRLKLDDDSHGFLDSLIRPYKRKTIESEQYIGSKNLIDSLKSKYLKLKNPTTSNLTFVVKVNGLCNLPPIYSNEVYEKAYQIIQKKMPNVFKVRKLVHNRLELLREIPAKCLLSNHVHENENAYILILKKNDNYVFRFGCYRKCGNVKTILLE